MVDVGGKADPVVGKIAGQNISVLIKPGAKVKLGIGGTARKRCVYTQVAGCVAIENLFPVSVSGRVEYGEVGRKGRVVKDVVRCQTIIRERLFAHLQIL